MAPVDLGFHLHGALPLTSWSLVCASFSNSGGLFVPGYRAVPLKNNYSESLELASLLVKIEIFPGKVRFLKFNTLQPSKAKRVIWTSQPLKSVCLWIQICNSLVG